jgi:hypothetical protein
MTNKEKRELFILDALRLAEEHQNQRMRFAGRLGGLATARNRKLRKLQEHYREGIL